MGWRKELRIAWIMWQWNWLPWKLRANVRMKEEQLRNCQNGWANTHVELFKLQEKIARCYNCSAWKQGETK